MFSLAKQLVKERRIRAYRYLDGVYSQDGEYLDGKKGITGRNGWISEKTCVYCVI